MTWFLGYVGSIVLANWMIQTFGIVPVGFGLAAPAGVFAAGLCFTFRDLVQERYGPLASVGAILIGGLVSWFVSPVFALASAGAFLVSELCDFAVYTPLLRRNWLGAVALSNTVGLVVDSALFLWLAFSDLTFLPGQVVAKLYVTLVAVSVLWLVKRSRPLTEVVA